MGLPFLWIEFAGDLAIPSRTRKSWATKRSASAAWLEAAAAPKTVLIPRVAIPVKMADSTKTFAK